MTTGEINMSFKANALAGSALAMIVLASPVHAQSNVTVYGRLNVGLVNYSGYGQGRGAATQENNLSSRIGFKGREDLGDGLAATFMLESGFSPDTGAGALGSRESSVGLQGSFGSVKLGYMLNPLDDLHGIAGPGYQSSMMNDNLNGFWANGYSNTFTGTSGNAGSTACTQVAGNGGATNSFAFDSRFGNSIRYDSPVINGFSAATHLSLGEVTGCNGMAWSSKVQYQRDAAIVALDYDLHHNVRGTGLNDQLLMLAAGYSVTPSLYLGGYFQALKYSNPGLRDLRQNGFGLTARKKEGQHTLELSWYHAGQGHGDQTPVFSGIYVGNGSASNIIMLGYRYALSKRTELWSQLVQLRNGSNAKYDIGGAGSAGGNGLAGRNIRAVAAGIKHDF